MSGREEYTPSPFEGAKVEKNDGDKWMLVLVRQLRHSPEKVWRALTEPAEVREWAPFDVDGNLGHAGAKVNFTWLGAPGSHAETIKRAEEPKVLEYSDLRWELEPKGGGTQLTLWHNIDRRFIAMGAAGWHVGLDVMDHLLSGHPIGRIAGPDTMKLKGWQQLNAQYAQEFGVEAGWPKTAH